MKVKAGGKNNAGGCEAYRKEVEKVFGKKLATTALFVASKESRNCTADMSLKKNSDGTIDYCIFQINDEPEVRHNLDLCIQRAYEKYTQGRIGTYNWSAWYAVCTTGPHPKPKYKNINCK